MSRELKMITWCDGDHDEDVESTIVRTIAVDGSKPMLLDLCETCDKVVQDMIAFMERGVLATKAVTAPVPRVRRYINSPEPTEPKRKDGKDRRDCPECDYIGNTRGAMVQHLKAKHGKAASEIDWTPR